MEVREAEVNLNPFWRQEYNQEALCDEKGSVNIKFLVPGSVIKILDE